MFARIFGLVFYVVFFVAFSSNIEAVTVAEQSQNWGNQLYVWQVIQELGNNLSGTISTFTFRADTLKTNRQQFDYTAQNTRLYDKDNNNYYIRGCVPAGSDPYDGLRGLTFSTTGVPPGYEDVTVDFSCRNYSFIPGHRYLILVTNANKGGGIHFAAAAYGPGGEQSGDRFTDGGLRYANGNPWDWYHSSGSCDVSRYVWNDTTINPWSGCNIWTSAKDDLYFVLSNTSPPPRLPVIFIPGIGGSEMKASQDIYWSAEDGHGGNYSHGYGANEKVWVNQDQAAALGEDDYFDVLRLKQDGVTPEADISSTGDLTPFGYSDIDPFFSGMGYVKGVNFFIFPYDWRKDIRTTKDDLDSLVELAKQKSGQPKVNLVVHSMGGLVGRWYISDASKAGKVNKLIELGIPHLGAPSAIKTLMHGFSLEKNVFGFIPVGIPATEIKDIARNNTSLFQLLPAKSYFNFYDNSNQDRPYPFKDDRDIDNDTITGTLNYDQIKTLFSNLAYNMTTFVFAEFFHSALDPILNQTSPVKVYEIVGTAQPTLGQIWETWWITWPIDLIPKTDEVYINGDGSVPLYSASLKNDSLDISGANKIYYVEQTHPDLVSSNGTAMQTVKAILNDDNSLPVEVKDQKIALEGQQISLDDGELDLYDDQNRHCGLTDNGEIEENIPDVTCTNSGNTKHAFVKKKASQVKVTATRKKPTNSSKKTTLKTRIYKQDKISKTTVYRDIPIGQKSKVVVTIDPTTDTSPPLILYPDSTNTDNTTLDPTSEATGSAALDQTPPVTSIQISGTKDSFGVYTNPVIVTLTGNDLESGILMIEYSVDSGETVQTYTGAFIISAPGKTTLLVKSIDKLGNEEIPQSIIIEIATPPTPSPTPSPSPSPTPTPTASPASTPTSTPSPTPTLTPSPTPTSTPAPSPTPSPAPTPTAGESPAPTASPTPTPTPSPSSTPVSSPTPASIMLASSPEINSSSTIVGNSLQEMNLGIGSQGILGTSSQKGPEKQKLGSANTKKVFKNQNLGGFLIISGGAIILLLLGLTAAFLKPSPK